MRRSFDVIVINGMLRPTGPVDLPENQRLRVTVEDAYGIAADRSAERQRLVEFLRSSPLNIRGPLPTRDELYEDRV